MNPAYIKTALLILSMFFTATGFAQNRPNVLFIAVDDLRPELACYGEQGIKSPNIDRLAREGIRFSRAYCQEAICGPSRTSLLTGLRPDTVGVVHNDTYFRDTVPDIVTLPEHFKKNGYETVYIGKIFHARMTDEEHSWSRKPTQGKPYMPRPLGGYQLPENRETVLRRQAEVKKEFGDLPVSGLASGPAFEAADVPDEAYIDGASAVAAVATLKELQGKPFFLAVGFHKPHLPFIAPKQYWDLYDPAKIELAGNPFVPKGAPSISLHSSFELRTRTGIPKQGPISDDLARTLIHAYYACVSYVDTQVGKILAELDRQGLRDNTIIVIWGDHGWHLGEHSIWGKATNFEIATRVPLIVVPPSSTQAIQGKTCDQLVELVDLYPTLCQLAGLTLPSHLEGTGFAPLLRQPERDWKKAVFSQFPAPALREWAAQPLSDAMRQTFFGPLIRSVEEKLAAEFPEKYDKEIFSDHLMGYTMRTDRYRLTRWVDTEHPEEAIAVELYDHEADPEENVNLAAEGSQSRLVQDLTKEMAAGWKAARP